VKALGLGLTEGPRSVRIAQIDPEGGGGRRPARRPGGRGLPGPGGGATCMSRPGANGDLIVATMIGELAGAEQVGVAVPSAY